MSGWIKDGSEVIRAWPHRVGVANETQIIQVEMEINLKKSGKSVHREKHRNYLSNGRKNYPTISVYNYDIDYDELELNFDVETIEHDNHMGFVTEDGQDYEAVHTICVRSDNTRKWFFSEGIDSTDNPEYTASITVPKSHVSRTLRVQPYIIKAIGNTSSSTDYATEAGEILATGCHFEIQLDRVSALSGGAIKPEWVSFREKGFPDAMYYPEIKDDYGDEQPEIILNWNMDISVEFQEMIDYEARNNTTKAKNRDSIYSQAAADLTYHLCQWASATYEEEPENEREILAKNILDTYSKRLIIPVESIKSAFDESDWSELEDLRAKIQHLWKTGTTTASAMGVLS